MHEDAGKRKIKVALAVYAQVKLCTYVCKACFEYAAAPFGSPPAAE